MLTVYIFISFCVIPLFNFQSKENKKVTWLQIYEETLSYACWLCRMYPSIANSGNKVYEGCLKGHVN